jgi:DNA-binding response OmpR family regulator
MLLVVDRLILAELIKLILKHGALTSRVVLNAAQVEMAVAEWQPHLVVLDMDLDGREIMALLRARTSSSGRLPVLGLTRRGDLRNKLAAFDTGSTTF